MRSGWLRRSTSVVPSAAWPSTWTSTGRRSSNRVRNARRDRGELPGELSADEREELKRLRRENFEQQRAIEILKAASAFFARELDRL